MNKLLFKESGQPLYLDDSEFVQESTADVLKTICSGMKLGEKHILLSDPVGMETLGSNTVYTIVGSGYVVIGDEVYPIKPDILTVPTSRPVYWVIVQEKSQNEIFADNSEAQAYGYRYVKLPTTCTKSDMHVGRNDIVTFRNRVLAIVTDYLDKIIIEKDMKVRLSLSEVVSGKAEIIYQAKQTDDETVYLSILAAANTGTSMIAPEMDGRRRLHTFDSSVGNISGMFSLSMSYTDPWDNPQSMIAQLTFDNGSCYIASADDSPLVQMPTSTILIEDTLKIWLIMAATYELKRQARELSTKKDSLSISPEEVGGLVDETLGVINEAEKNQIGLRVRSTYTTAAEVNTDSISPVGSDGKPLKFGQITTVYDENTSDAADNGNIYTFQNPGWKLVLTTNNLSMYAKKGDVRTAKDTADTAQKKANETVESAKKASENIEKLSDNIGTESGSEDGTVWGKLKSPSDDADNTSQDISSLMVDFVHHSTKRFDEIIADSSVMLEQSNAPTEDGKIVFLASLDGFACFVDNKYYPSWRGTDAYMNTDRTHPHGNEIYLFGNKTYIYFVGALLSADSSAIQLAASTNLATEATKKLTEDAQVTASSALSLANKALSVINVNEICSDSVYSLPTAIAAITERESADNVTCRRPDVVLTYKIAEGEWESRQFAGSSLEGFATEANWTDFDDAGSDMTSRGAVLLVDEIVPLSNGYYILQTTINALTVYKTANEAECIKPGVVIIYRTGKETFESKQLCTPRADYNDLAAWNSFGSAVGGTVETDFEITKDNVSPVAGGAIYDAMSVGVDDKQAEDGAVCVYMKDAGEFPLNNGFTFAVGTGGDGDVAGTIVCIYPRKTPLYAALGADDLTIRFATPSRTGSGEMVSHNSIETLQLKDKSTRETLETFNMNRESSPSNTDYTFTISVKSYLNETMDHKFVVIATDDGGDTARKTTSVTAVNLKFSHVWALYKALREGSRLITMTNVLKLSSANKSTVTAHVKIGDERKLISQTNVASTRLQDLQINASPLGLKHGAYTVRIVA